MYGLVNNGVRTYLIDHHGPHIWEEVCKTAGIGHDDFETMEAYDDAITYDLVGAISQVLNLSAEQVLEVFGAFWVDYAQSTSVGKLIARSGDNFWERLRGLDDMHERVQITMPHLKPPSFDLQNQDGDTGFLHYYSSREGLAPMVIGLLHGLAGDCGVAVEIDHLQAKSSGADHDVFHITLVTRQQAA